MSARRSRTTPSPSTCAERARRRLAGVLVALTILCLGAPAAAPAAAAGSSAGAGAAALRTWAPHFRAAVAWARHRRGAAIAFCVRTEGHLWAYHPDVTFFSASVLKAMLLVAYLNQRSVAHRRLTSNDLELLSPMIRRSDDTAATRVFNIVGEGALYHLAHRVHMTNFHVASIWGRSRIDARDQSLFFLHIDRFIPPRHRDVALHLLATVIHSQRWGLATVHVPGWRLYFKGGWGLGTGWVDHQVALYRRGNQRVSVAILTSLDPNHAYGKATLRGITLRLMRGLGPNSRVLGEKP